MRFSPVPFHWWKYPVAEPGMEKRWRMHALSDWRPVVPEGDSNTQPRSLCWGPRCKTRAPGLGGEPLREDWWGRVNAEGLMPNLALVLKLTSWNSNQIQCSTHFLWRLAWWLRGKESACNAGDEVRFLGKEDPLKKGMATSILAWRIPRTQKPGGLWYIGSQNQTGL